jgi:hypothetical protein
MSDTMSVDAFQAAALFDGLNPREVWLLSVPAVRHRDPALQEQAERFIFSVADRGLTGWGDTPQEVKEAVSLWMQEFHGFLLDERSPLFTTEWEVMSDDTPLQKILYIASCEIQQKHPNYK